MTVLPHRRAFPFVKWGRVTAFSERKLESVRADQKITDQ
jgi:hypothetical protein